PARVRPPRRGAVLRPAPGRRPEGVPGGTPLRHGAHATRRQGVLEGTSPGRRARWRGGSGSPSAGGVTRVSPKPLRVALFGSPAFALPTLEALDRRHDLALVVTQPDKPAGRGLALQPPAAAARARELGIEVAQP